MENKKQILICDDELGVRESLNLILSDDYDLTFTDNGLKAIEKIKTAHFDALLLDIKMPKVHGLEILKEAKSIRAELPVIIVTGYQSAEIAKQAIIDGASHYIPKPFESEQILKAVAEVTSAR